MKKFLKVVLIIVLVLVVLLALNIIRNICIINKIRNNANEYCSDITSYKITTTSSYTIEGENAEEIKNGTTTETICHKDGKNIGKVVSQTEGSEATETINDLSDEINYLECMQIDYWLNEDYLDSSDNNSNNKLITYCFNFIKSSGDNYVIKVDDGTFEVYFNKETGMVTKYGGGLTCSFEKNSVTDEEFENLQRGI